MRKASQDFLMDLLQAPSPSGYEQPAQEVVRAYARGFADDVRTDVHGNVIAARNAKAAVRVMLAGHCDQIGLMVRYIEDNGAIRCASIGGVDPVVVVASPMVIHTSGGPITGVVGRKPIHLLTAEQRRSERLEIPELWIDIGAKDKKTAAKLVEIGDPVTFPLQAVELQRDLIAAPGCDDKVGVFVAMEALRLAPASKLRCAVCAVSTVQEEVGLRGARTSAFGLDPHAGIAIDVTHATDSPGIDPKRSGEIKLQGGPAIARGPNINPPLRDILIKAAKDRRIAFQHEPEPGGTGTDANAIQISRAGVAAGLISIPNRYMHSRVEVVSLRDLENSARLLAEAMTRIDSRTDFTP